MLGPRRFCAPDATGDKAAAARGLGHLASALALALAAGH